jgi:hypothetical protein
MTTPKPKRLQRAWMHHGGAPFGCASPVIVLSRGPKRSHVKLVQQLRWNRKWCLAGSTRYVPTYCLGDVPWPGHLIAVGHSTFVPANQARAKRAVERWSGK